MNDTHVTLSAEQQRRMAQGYTEEGKATSEWHADDVFAGAGALRSSVKDMLRYVAAQVGETKTALDAAIQDTHVVRIHKTDIPDHGQALGWLALSMGKGNPPNYWHWHNGGTGGFDTFIGFDKTSRTGVIVLSNRDDSGDAATVAGITLLAELAVLPATSAPASSKPGDKEGR
jgi:CubicO group peptidase (beta-lactamase class C family)